MNCLGELVGNMFTAVGRGSCRARVAKVHLYPGFWTDFVLVLNEMVLVLVLDFPSDRVRVLPFGRSTSTKTQGNWNAMFKDVGKDEVETVRQELHPTRVTNS